jgi:hypothetical protein
MTIPTDPPTLASLPLLPYLDENGLVAPFLLGKIGVYAIFDQHQILQFVGFSRDVYLSLKQHLVRQPQQCYGFKVQLIERPSRTVLAEIRQKWIAENGCLPLGNGDLESLWTQPIDAKLTMTTQEKADWQGTDGLGQVKLMKSVARRLEAEIQAQLEQRGVKEDLRFNPKLKEEGLLDLK